MRRDSTPLLRTSQKVSHTLSLLSESVRVYLLSDSVRCVLKWCMQVEETIVLGSKEQRRAQVLNRVVAGGLSQ